MDRKDVYNHLTKVIIPFWNKLKDDEFGGFYGYANENAIPMKEYDKGVILNNRILWFYSNAYAFLKDEKLKEMAEHAYLFTVNHGIDRTYGGVYWSLDYKGNPKDTEKHTYNQAFAIYALSSFYIATKKEEALSKAMEIFDIVETKCKDKNGYLECFTRNFSPAENDKLSENGVMATRTMNTLLHVLEAYTELYRASKDEKVEMALRDAIVRFKNVIWNPKKKICEVFFDEEYHSLIDLESYGHEIEASWLLTRAIDVLEDLSLFEECKEMILDMAKSPYIRGMNEKKNAMFYECENGIDLKKHTWWVMAEAVLGFYNAYTISKNTMYIDASNSCYQFIMDYIYDKDNGEWIEDYYPNQENKKQALVHPWKCPYHNGRMLLELLRRLPTEPVDLDATRKTKELYRELQEIGKKKRYLFGHQNPTWIKISKSFDSDVREMTGELPGLFGIDSLALAGFEMNPNSQEDSLKKSIEYSILAHNEGCVITLSCHMPNFSSKNIIHKDGKILFHSCDFLDTKLITSDSTNILDHEKYHKEFISYLDLICEYLLALQEKGIPVLFRPFHEQNGNWFWWGKSIDKAKYIELYRYTVQYLKKKNVHNVLYVYSPNGPIESIDAYLREYPGDDYIDVLGLDYYDDYLYQESFREDYFILLDASSKIVYQTSMLHGKIPAISEVGVRVSKTKENNDLNGLLPKNNPILGHNWFCRIGDICRKYGMPYYLVWGNFDKKNTYLPYIDGTPHELVEEFLNMYQSPSSIFSKERLKS